jgi:hypothetical protein
LKSPSNHYAVSTKKEVIEIVQHLLGDFDNGNGLKITLLPLRDFDYVFVVNIA